MCLVCVWCKGIFYKLIIYVLRYLLWDDDVTTCLFFAYGVFLSTLYNHLKWCTFGNAWPFMKLKSIHYIITFHSLTLWIIILLHHYVNLWKKFNWRYRTTLGSEPFLHSTFKTQSRNNNDNNFVIDQRTRCFHTCLHKTQTYQKQLYLSHPFKEIQFFEYL